MTCELLRKCYFGEVPSSLERVAEVVSNPGGVACGRQDSGVCTLTTLLHLGIERFSEWEFFYQVESLRLSCGLYGEVFDWFGQVLCMNFDFLSNWNAKV